MQAAVDAVVSGRRACRSTQVRPGEPEFGREARPGVALVRERVYDLRNVMILDGYEGGFYHSREVPMARLQSASLQKEAPGSVVLEGGEFKNSLVCSRSAQSEGTPIDTLFRTTAWSAVDWILYRGTDLGLALSTRRPNRGGT